jgi:hypothetical protein
MKQQLAILASLVICHIATAQTPKAARYIELHFPFGKVHYLGAIPTADQTGVRWRWVIEAGFNQNYRTVATPVYTWPNISLKDFASVAACCADAETATLDIVKNYEQTKHTAVFYGNSGNENHSEGNDQLDVNQ